MSRTSAPGRRPSTHTDPFAAVPHRLIDDADLAPQHLALAAYLQRRIWRGWGKMPVAEIMAHFDVSRRTVQLWLAALEKAEWIERYKGKIYLTVIGRTLKNCPALGPFLDELERRGCFEPYDWDAHFGAKKEGAIRCAPSEPPPPISGCGVEDEVKTPLNPPTTTTTAPPPQSPTPMPPPPPRALQAVLRPTQPPPAALATLSEQEAEALEQLNPVVREQTLAWIASGDRILVSEARKRLQPVAPPPPPASLEAALDRIKDPLVPTSLLARMLCEVLGDAKTATFRCYDKLAVKLKSGTLEAREVLRVLGYAMRAKQPARYFSRAISGAP